MSDGALFRSACRPPASGRSPRRGSSRASRRSRSARVSSSGARIPEARVVDEDVEPLEAREQHVDEVVERGHDAHVDDVVGGLAAGLRDLLRRPRAASPRGARRGRPSRRRAAERERERPAQPRGRAGQERDLSRAATARSRLRVSRLRHVSSARAWTRSSHGIAGLGPRRARSPDRPGARAAFCVGAVAAMVPDLDFLFFSTRLDYLRDHRSWTHSFVVLPFLALGDRARREARSARRARLRTLWLFAAIGIASHILFDWITSLRHDVLRRRSRATRYSLDWVFILDPVLHRDRRSRRLVARARLPRPRAPDRGRRRGACSAAYIAFCALVHARALAIWKRIDAPPAGRHGRGPAAVPLAVSLARPLRPRRRGPRGVLRRRPVRARRRPTRSRRRSGREILSSLPDFYPPPERARIRRFAQAARLAASLDGGARAARTCRSTWRSRAFPLETVLPEPDGGADGHRAGPAVPAVVHRALGARRRGRAPPAALRLPRALRRRPDGPSSGASSSAAGRRLSAGARRSPAT